MRVAILGVVVLALLGLVGCGGGGGNVNPGSTGQVTGTLSAANPASYRIMLDGAALDVRPAADGTFAIPNLPAGSHTIAFVSGLVGVYLSVEIDPDGTTDVGEVVPVAGGQIVGLVLRRDDDGTLTPLSGVEVLADPEPIYEIMGSTSPAQVETREGDSLSYKAITDENGSYVIPAVPEGAYVVTVNVPGLMQGVAYVWVGAGQTAPADFQLVAAVEEGIGTVAGHVTAVLEGGSQALAGALVTITSDGGWQPVPPTDPVILSSAVRSLGVVPPGADCIIAPPYIFNQFSTLTARDGSYSLNVPSGHLQISVWAEGYEDVYDSLTLQPNETVTRDYALAPWTVIEEPGDGGDGTTGAHK